MIKAVLFDLDATLLDHAGAAVEALVQTQPDADPARWAELTDLTYDRYLAGELTLAEQRRVRVTLMARELGRVDSALRPSASPSGSLLTARRRALDRFAICRTGLAFGFGPCGRPSVALACGLR